MINALARKNLSKIQESQNPVVLLWDVKELKFLKLIILLEVKVWEQASLLGTTNLHK